MLSSDALCFSFLSVQAYFFSLINAHHTLPFQRVQCRQARWCCPSLRSASFSPPNSLQPLSEPSWAESLALSPQLLPRTFYHKSERAPWPWLIHQILIIHTVNDVGMTNSAASFLSFPLQTWMISRCNIDCLITCQPF